VELWECARLHARRSDEAQSTIFHSPVRGRKQLLESLQESIKRAGGTCHPDSASSPTQSASAFCGAHASAPAEKLAPTRERCHACVPSHTEMRHVTHERQCAMTHCERPNLRRARERQREDAYVTQANTHRKTERERE